MPDEDRADPRQVGVEEAAIVEETGGEQGQAVRADAAHGEKRELFVRRVAGSKQRLRPGRDHHRREGGDEPEAGGAVTRR